MPTQLQLRINASAWTGKVYSPETRFIDLRSYRNSDFVGEGTPLSKLMDEGEVKSGESYESIRPAVQARLAYMDSCKEIAGVLQKYSGRSRIKRGIGRVKIAMIGLRNERLRRKAVNLSMKRKGITWKDVRRNELGEMICNGVYALMKSHPSPQAFNELVNERQF